jgi:SPOR domain
MLRAMRHAPFLAICLLASLVAGTAAAGPTVEEGPLAPCSQRQGGSADSSVEPAFAWGVEIATSFSKQEALAEFDRVKQDHADLLGSYDPMVVESCDLHMGTDLQYSVRIGRNSRDAADKLCAKLQAAGGACIVQKN